MLNSRGAAGARAELEKALDRHAELADEIAEVRDDEIVVEGVVPGGDRRVRREDAVGGHRFQRRVERQPGGRDARAAARG